MYNLSEKRMCACVDAYFALFRLWHRGGAVCRVVEQCNWFAEVRERNVMSFVEEAKRKVSVRVKGWIAKHSFVGSM